VAVFGHFSNWELLGRLTTLFPQYRFGAIYRKLSNAAVNRHFNKSRARLGVRLFDRQEEFWNAVAFLESGGVLGVLSDQYAGVSGTQMPFLGRMTSSSTLAAALAHRVNVPIVPIKISTTGFARWQVVVGQPIPEGPSIDATTAAINHHLETQIRDNPADWLWTHNRWKDPPAARA
jgi:KDO2-lipid IV(A) lauroyltransferase